MLARVEAEVTGMHRDLEDERVKSESLRSEVARLEGVDTVAQNLTHLLEQRDMEMDKLRTFVRIARNKAHDANELLREGLDQARQQEALAVEYYKSSPEYLEALEARARVAMEVGYRECFKRVSALVSEADLSQAAYDVLAAEHDEDEEEEEEAEEDGLGPGDGAAGAAAEAPLEPVPAGDEQAAQASEVTQAAQAA